jgi:UDP-N-acetylglucosamine/UDP-N-acetylgalactosamine diphosphorylase
MDEHAALIRKFEEAGQGHVFRFWPRLSAEQRAVLVAHAREIDLEEVTRLGRELLPARRALSADTPLRPAPYVALPGNGGSRDEWSAATRIGEQALRDGRVACFTVAGGQGTRLGYHGPKGLFPVTPVTGKSLYQVFAEKLRAAQRAYGVELPWLVMTSDANHEPTVAFLKDRRHFGLKPDQVHLFRQGRMPAVDFAGRILLEEPHRIALSPDGHGGSLRALARSGGLERLERAGIDVISYFQVDNPLVPCVDPALIGFHLSRGSEMSSVAVPKASPTERVGVFCLREGRLGVVEYSDLPAELASRTDEAGRLVYGLGSIAVHLLSTSFARRMIEGTAGALPFHRADKAIPCVDDTGATQEPDAPNGVKFEMFVFDALPFARNPIVVEARREEMFSPVKNASGADSPDSCRRHQLRLFGRWMRVAGIAVTVDADEVPTLRIEISPLFAVDAASFAESWRRLEPKPAIVDGLVLG